MTCLTLIVTTPLGPKPKRSFDKVEGEVSEQGAPKASKSTEVDTPTPVVQQTGKGKRNRGKGNKAKESEKQ